MMARAVVVGWCLLMAACLPEDGTSQDASELQALPASLAGSWRVEGMVTSDCPLILQRVLPLGDTLWVHAAGELSIAGETPAQSPVQLTPVSERLLARTTEVAIPGCTGTEDLMLEVEHLGEHMAQGTFTAALAHDGSEGCLRVAETAGLPPACTTRVQWMAHRR